MEYDFDLKKEMKLYLLSQDDNNGWDTYDSCVVCAESEDDAKTITPDGGVFQNISQYNGGWARNFSSIKCEEIGLANENQKRGVICASYNAG
jgi:hypothetical protein